MEFVVTALDFKDALARRFEHRDAHLNGLRSMAKQGKFISGGAMLDDQGTMIGSNVHVAFENREQLDNWLKADPFTVHGVWETVEVRAIKLLETV